MATRRNGRQKVRRKRSGVTHLYARGMDDVDLRRFENIAEQVRRHALDRGENARGYAILAYDFTNHEVSYSIARRDGIRTMEDVFASWAGDSIRRHRIHSVESKRDLIALRRLVAAADAMLTGVAVHNDRLDVAQARTLRIEGPVVRELEAAFRAAKERVSK